MFLPRVPVMCITVSTKIIFSLNIITMKSTTTIIGILLMFTTLTSSGCMYIIGVDGNGNVKTENRDVSSFDEIKVGGAFNVLLIQGGKEALKVEADENLLPIIETRVSGGTLIITTKEDIRNAKSLNLYITFRDLSKLNISGACEVKSEGTLEFETLKFKASGASEIKMALTADRLLGDYSGASEITFSGRARDVELDLSGASELKAYDLQTENMRLDISGAGDAKVHATKTLKVEASGAASVRYEGNPSVDQRVSGAGDVRKR
jgi:hypothetical protein